MYVPVRACWWPDEVDFVAPGQSPMAMPSCTTMFVPVPSGIAKPVPVLVSVPVPLPLSKRPKISQRCALLRRPLPEEELNLPGIVAGSVGPRFRCSAYKADEVRVQVLVQVSLCRCLSGIWLGATEGISATGLAPPPVSQVSWQ